MSRCVYSHWLISSYFQRCQIRLQMSVALCKYVNENDSWIQCEFLALPTYQTRSHSVTHLFAIMTHVPSIFQTSYVVSVRLTFTTYSRAEQRNWLNGGTAVTSVLIERVSTWHTQLWIMTSVYLSCIDLSLIYFVFHSLIKLVFIKFLNSILKCIKYISVFISIWTCPFMKSDIFL